MRRRVRRAWAVVVVAAIAFAGWAFFFEPRLLTVRRVELALPRWPRETPPLRVALLSDLHVGSPYWGLERIGELVERTNAEEPDIVLLAGDYVIDSVRFGTKVEHEPIARALSGLRARHGVIAVLGNHDWANGGERMRRALESVGIGVLDNEVHTFQHQGRPITVAGLADELEREPLPEATFDRAPVGAALVALVHEPDVFPSIDDRPAIVLAGHTHGGQVRLPLLGRRVVPSRFGERYAAGHVVEGGRHLFVTTGVGTSIFPVRFGVPPEIVMITLRGPASTP